MSKKQSCSEKKCSIGGQALMEGIMMRGPQKSAMAVRRMNGEIYFEEQDNTVKKRPSFCKWPIIRGVFGFIDSLVMGYKYLMKSADISFEDIAAEEQKEQAPMIEEAAAEGADAATAAPEKKEKESSGAMTATLMIVATVLGVLLAVALFMWLPSFLYTLLEKLAPNPFAGNRLLRSVFEGLLKIVILVAYMALVSLMKDIRRTFMYHGAEHKTIFCYEKGFELTVENVRKQRRFHPRCGTSFLILMLIVSIVIGLFIPVEIAGIGGYLYTVIRALIKLLLIPLTMGIGYELLKLAGKHDNVFTRIISAPGMWLQNFTTNEPDDSMIEVAINAVEAVLPEHEGDDRW